MGTVEVKPEDKSSKEGATKKFGEEVDIQP